MPYEQTKVEYANDFLFQEFGRDIAFAEREHLVKSILNTPNLVNIEVEPEKPEPLLAKIREAISAIRRTGHEPRVIFPSIPHYLTLYQFGKLVEYNNATPKPVLPASLNIDKCKLKIISPSGQIPKDTILFADNAITWNVKTHPKQGVLYADIGNDRLYPKKYVNVLAVTSVKCNVKSESIVILKDKTTKE